MDDSFWRPEDGALFVYIGGEGTVTGPPSGYLQDLAPSYNALLVSLEHRFYGESIPNGSMETANLKYLTVDQALADLDSFIHFFQKEFKTGDAPVFAFGGSYPGALASWYRIAYPETTKGSLSSSGVVNAILNFPEFDEQIRLSAGETCSANILATREAFEELVNDSQEGLARGLELFQCAPDLSLEDFHYMIADSWSMAVQYGGKADLCSALASIPPGSRPAMYRQAFAAFTLDFWGQDFCSCFYNTACLADPARWTVNERSWRWQKCHELAYFQVAPENQPLRSPVVTLDYHLSQCEAIFGIENMTPATEEINSKFGGDLPTAQNTFYSDFSDDPWQRASVNQTVTPSQPYYLTVCDGCGHCKDLHAESESDPENLKTSRQMFESYLKEWISS